MNTHFFKLSRDNVVLVPFNDLILVIFNSSANERLDLADTFLHKSLVVLMIRLVLAVAVGMLAVYVLDMIA